MCAMSILSLAVCNVFALLLWHFTVGNVHWEVCTKYAHCTVVQSLSGH